MKNKLIITAAITGAEVTRDQQPALPLLPDEIAEEVFQCVQVGAAMIHLHARTPEGDSTQDKKTYRKIIEAIKKRCDVIIQVSTGGAVGMTPAERLQPVTLKPEMATLTMGTVNFGDDVFINHPKDIEEFAKTMVEYGVKPELEIFDTGMMTTALRWLKKGTLFSPAHFDFLMGVPGAMSGTPEMLMYMKSMLPDDATWTVAGISSAELPLGVLAIALGGHVRVGFEDNVYYRKGELATSNAQLVGRIARIAQEMGRATATPEEARQILGLKKA